MGATMDDVGHIFGFEQLSHETFEQCQTAGDIADYLSEEIGRWIKIEADSSYEEFASVLVSFNREMRWYLRKPVGKTDLDRPLTDVFERKRKRWPRLNRINDSFNMMRSHFSHSVPELTRRPWVRPAAHCLWTGYWIMLAGMIVVSVSRMSGRIELPDSMLILGIPILIMLSPFISITVTAFLPSRFFYANPEPELTLRTMLTRYAQKLREKHGDCGLEHIQSHLLQHWTLESGERATLSTPVPWLDKG